ncbi:MAG TPA: hypothetical protein VGF16_16730 [Bryobacteraceae bacterium]|jgi:hypothetical protein
MGELTLPEAEAIIKLAERRAALVRQMREALERKDEPEALRLARLVAGIEEQPDEGH